VGWVGVGWGGVSWNGVGWGGGGVGGGCGGIRHLERLLWRCQESPIGVVNQVQDKPTAAPPIAGSVQCLQTLDAPVEHPSPPLLVHILGAVAG
jgi:hypothetical protein